MRWRARLTAACGDAFVCVLRHAVRNGQYVCGNVARSAPDGRRAARSNKDVGLHSVFSCGGSR
eukprot:7380939-Prymnesium_polylepis.1